MTVQELAQAAGKATAAEGDLTAASKALQLQVEAAVAAAEEKAHRHTEEALTAANQEAERRTEEAVAAAKQEAAAAAARERQQLQDQLAAHTEVALAEVRLCVRSAHQHHYRFLCGLTFAHCHHGLTIPAPLLLLCCFVGSL